MTWYFMLPFFALFVLFIAVTAEKTFTWYALTPVFAVCILMLVFATLDMLKELIAFHREGAANIPETEGSIEKIQAG